MIGDIQDINCNKCGKYLFTEEDTVSGYKRLNDNKEYIYDKENDVFLCDKCR